MAALQEKHCRVSESASILGGSWPVVLNRAGKHEKGYRRVYGRVHRRVFGRFMESCIEGCIEMFVEKFIEMLKM